MWFEKLKQMKKKSGKTSQQISDETGIPKSTIDKLFSGKTKEPYLSSTRDIVHCLGYTLDDLDDIDYDSSSRLKSIDVKKDQLLHNYNILNENAQTQLVDYSEFLASKQNNLRVDGQKVKMIRVARSVDSKVTEIESDISDLINAPRVNDEDL